MKKFNPIELGLVKTMRSILFLISLFCCSTTFAQDLFNVLLYTRQDTWHYENIPFAAKAFHEMAEKHQFGFTWTQDAQDLTKELQKYQAVVFLNANADPLTDEQLNALKYYVQGGGGFVGIHASSNGKIRKPWFDKLMGGVFTDPPQLQAAVLRNVKPDFPSNMHLPKYWLWSDEWYNFELLQSDNLNVLLTVDESTYDYKKGYDEVPLKGMGENHSIAWYQLYDGGRSFYTALGHRPQSYESDMFLDHLFGGMYWAATGKPVND